MSPNSSSRLAVIGFGPRGLGALEALYAETRDHATQVTVDIFDPFDWPAAGPNFAPDQSAHCILNIPIRALDIDPPSFLADLIPPFADWSSTPYQPDDFPPRSDLGAYLHARFKALCAAAEGRFEITHTKTAINGLTDTATGWWLEADGQQYGPYDEILLAQGQPATSPDPQRARWAAYAADHKLTLTSAYPANDLLQAARDWQGKTVAIRGLGLSTLDVVRLLTWGLSGQFEDGKYSPSGREPHRILPFSLDGMPPAAKPATGAVDGQYDPTAKETRAFEAALNDTLSQQPDAALQTVCAALVAPAVRILTALGAAKTKVDVQRWLAAERDAPGTQEDQPATAALKAAIEMAHGRVAPSVGYVIGQLWRKWQNPLRSGVNAVRHTPLTAAALVGFDEGLKRYSYGPPVSAAEELLTLIECGLVSLCTADDPAVLLEPTGWRLIEGEDGLLAPVMIDAVLANPDLEQISDPLIVTCMSEGRIRHIADGLGAHTLPDGQLVNREGVGQIGISLLGRLALGSVIAPDSLHDCFGSSTIRWAKGFAKRRF